MNPVANSPLRPLVPYSVPSTGCHYAVSDAVKAYNEAKLMPTSRLELPDSVKTPLENVGKAVFTEQSDPNLEHTALASLVDLAAQGGPLGEEACEVLFNACDLAYLAKGPSNKSVLHCVTRIEKVGAKALAAFEQAQKDGKVEKMPVDLLHVAWQQAKNEGNTVLEEQIKPALESKLGASAPALVQDPSIALEEIKKVARGTYGGTLVEGLGVVDLSGKPPTEAERGGWFKDLKEGQQRPVSFKLDDNTFVHGFVHIDAKGKQHIVVVSNNPDKDFGARFAKALGLPEESCTMEKLSGLGACKGMSEAGLAKWLFRYCAAHGGGTKEVVQQFQKHVQEVGKQGIVDFTEAQRVRRLAAEGSKSQSKQMTKADASVALNESFNETAYAAEYKKEIDKQYVEMFATGKQKNASNSYGSVSGVISLNAGQAGSDSISLSEIQLVSANELVIENESVNEDSVIEVESEIDNKSVIDPERKSMVLDGKMQEEACFSCFG